MAVMNNQENVALITEKLKEIALQNEKAYRSKLELVNLTHPENQIISPVADADDEGFWAAGYFTLTGQGVSAALEGKFTCEKGDFHIDGHLYGLIFGSSTGAAIICVYNPLWEHFFDTDLAIALAEDFATTTISFLWNGLLVATLTGPSFGALAVMGGTARITRY